MLHEEVLPKGGQLCLIRREELLTQLSHRLPPTTVPLSPPLSLTTHINPCHHLPFPAVAANTIALVTVTVSSSPS